MPKKLIKKKKKTFIEFKKFIEKTVDEIMVFAGLGDYEFNYVFSNKIEEFPHDKVAYAKIDVDEKYLTAKIWLYRPLFEHYQDGSYGTIRDALCHELSHIKVNILQRIAEDRFPRSEDLSRAVENVTEIMSRLIFRALYKKKGK